MDNSMETYKIILFGAPSIIKANLLTQYLKLKNGSKFRLQKWDTPGQVKFISLTKNYFLGQC